MGLKKRIAKKVIAKKVNKMKKSYLDQATDTVSFVTNTGKEKTKRVLIIFFTLVIIALLLGFWKKIKTFFAKVDSVELPDGSSWSPGSTVRKIRAALKKDSWMYWAGLYDGDAFFNAISDKTTTQLAAVYNQYNKEYKPDNLITDITSVMGDNQGHLNRALEKFNFPDVNPNGLLHSANHSNLHGNLLK